MPPHGSSLTNMKISKTIEIYPNYSIYSVEVMGLTGLNLGVTIMKLPW